MIWMPAKPLRAQTSCRWASSHSVPHFFCKDVSSSSIVMVLKEETSFKTGTNPKYYHSRKITLSSGKSAGILIVCAQISSLSMCVCLSWYVMCVCAHTRWAPDVGNGNHTQCFGRAARALNCWAISRSFTFSFTVTVLTSLFLIQQVLSHLTCLLLSFCTLFKGERN